MAVKTHREIACGRYVKFLFKSYLKWGSSSDLYDISTVVHFHQATMVENKAYYPSSFLDLLQNEILVYLETEYGCTALGWYPNARCSLVPDARALNLEIWFTRLERISV